jgi:hypothetical protein
MNCPICDVGSLHLFCRALNRLYGCANIYGCGKEAQCKHCPLIIAVMAKELMDEKRLSVADAVRLSVENSEEAIKARLKVRKILAKEFGREFNKSRK